MKKMMFGVLAMAALVGCSTQPKFTISGQVEGVEKMYLVEVVEGQPVAVDSVAVVEGGFELKGVADQPKAVYVADNVNLRAARVRAKVYAEAGQMTLEQVAEGDYVAVGTPTNDAAAANAKQMVALGEEFEEATPERREEIYAEVEEIRKGLLEQNKNNLLGVEALQQAAYEMTGKELQETIASFSPEMQATEAMKPLIAMAEKKIKTDVGQPSIDFEQADKEGTMVSLKSVIENPANKYVLVDFWASWCGPCMAEVPALKAAYDEYHKKGFEIFGVSLDNKKEAWEAAIKNKDLNWLHVSDLQGWQNAAADLYGVRSIPANYLVECATGKIVGVNLRGEAVAEKVAEYLK